MSTRSNIIIKKNGQDSQRFVYHHCDGYFEGVGFEIRNNIIPKYIKKYKEFSVNDLFVELTDYDSQYQKTDAIHGDIEYLYILEVIEPDHLVFKCLDVPGFDKYDYEKEENCTLIYFEHFYMNGIKMKVIDKCTSDTETENDDSIDKEYSENYSNEEFPNVEEATEVIDDAKNSLESIDKRNMLVSQVVNANYEPYMTKNTFTQILKDFYDVIILKAKLNII